MNEPISAYAAPKSDVSNIETETPLAIVPATRGLRFVNMLIDYVFYLVITAIFAFAITLVLMWIYGVNEGEQVMLATLEDIPDFLVGLPIYLLYYILFETWFGRTIGKFVTGTKVVNEEGLKPGFKQILGRTFSRFVPFEAFSFFAEDARGWHDRWPKTYVVKCR